MFKVLSRFSKYVSGLAIAFGAMVLTGWALHIQRLKGIIPGQVAVKANAAVCFILIGLALWLAVSGTHKRFTSVTSKLLALLASFIGLLSFLEYWNGWDLGIDQLLFVAGPDDLPGSVRLALMAPIAAADFFLLGIAIGMPDIKGRWSRVLRSLLSATAAIAVMFGIIDFVIDPQNTHTHIAPMTALILFFLSFAVLFARTEGGRELKDQIAIAFVPNYDVELAKLITAGVDLWLNTPQAPLEASGTSGMKAALNGIPSLSVLDGWWLEGLVDGVTGWAIGDEKSATEVSRSRDVACLYERLEATIVPMFYHDRERFIDIMRHAIAINGSHFNTQRMLQQYISSAYLR